MQIPPLLLDANTSEVAGAPLEALNAVVLYEDVAAAKRALTALSRITGIREDIEIRPKPWRFGLLNEEAVYVGAMRDGASADMIVISTSGQAAVPPILRAWLGEALDKIDHPVTVVFIGERELSNETLHNMRLVQLVAEEYGVDFFTPWVEPQLEEK